VGAGRLTHASDPSADAWPACVLRDVRGLPRSVAQPHVWLLGVEPAVWRRVLVPHATALRTLHRVLQVVMGWEDHHLWAFHVGGEGGRAARYGEPDDDWPVEGLRPAAGVRLRAVAPVEGARLEYVYDFGDHWRHGVTVEALLPNLLATTIGEDRLPYCVAGAGACPPEDIGGAGAYADVLAALRAADDTLARPRDAVTPDEVGRAEDLRAQVGGDFDPAAFSARQVNRELRLRFGPRSAGDASMRSEQLAVRRYQSGAAPDRGHSAVEPSRYRAIPFIGL
jgi:hypothetical protein